MKYLDWTLPTAEQNLAADEALLDWCEEHDDTEVLRFWEAERHFVVVGYANDVATEVKVAACAAREVPILRRCSGGGTVLQGPGCLNYAVVLRIDPEGPTRNVSATNRFVMERNAGALNAALRGLTSTIEVQGHTDLTLDGLKVSGNSQRRRRRWLLFHGTMLWRLDLALVADLLPLPSRQPDYRRGRPHETFLRNLPLAGNTMKKALRQVWEARGSLTEPPMEAVAALVQDRYGQRDWNLRPAGRR